MAARRALVTGGTSGIGLAVAQTLGEAGHAVTVAGRSAERIAASGLNGVVMDVCDPQSIAAALASMEPFDIVVANAGGAQTAPAVKASPALWDEMIALNLSSLFHCARASVPVMVERGWGRFIAIGSTASLKGYRYASAYAAAKHGALGFIRSLALELAPSGVTANLIAPGYTDTPMIAAAIDALGTRTRAAPGDLRGRFEAANPMGRLIDPAEVAATAVWLASDAAGAVNGQAIVIDGGETA